MGRLLSAVWLVPYFALNTALMGLGSILASLVSATWSRSFARVWARMNAGPAGLKIKVEGLENLTGPDSATADGGGCVLAANHSSAADIAAILGGLRVDICWVTKADLLKIPFLGWHLKRVHIPITRRGAEAGRFLADGAEKIKAGAVVAIFPEGTRNRHPEELLPFRRGAFALARLSGRPVVPTAIIGSADLWPPNRLIPSRGVITMRLGRSVDPADYPDEDLTPMAQDVRRAVDELRQGTPAT